jgi:hypothetical protein
MAGQDLVRRDHHVEVMVEVAEEPVALFGSRRVRGGRQEPESLRVGRVGPGCVHAADRLPDEEPGGPVGVERQGIRQRHDLVGVEERVEVGDLLAVVGDELIHRLRPVGRDAREELREDVAVASGRPGPREDLLPDRPPVARRFLSLGLQVRDGAGEHRIRIGPPRSGYGGRRGTARRGAASRSAFRDRSSQKEERFVSAAAASADSFEAAAFSSPENRPANPSR